MTQLNVVQRFSRTPNLRRLKVNALVMNDEFPHDSRVEFDEAEVLRLLRANPMSRLERMDAALTVKNIATAKLLIEALATTALANSDAESSEASRPRRRLNGGSSAPAVEMRTLNIRVGLPQDDYPDQVSFQTF